MLPKIKTKVKNKLLLKMKITVWEQWNIATHFPYKKNQANFLN